MYTIKAGGEYDIPQTISQIIIDTDQYVTLNGKHSNIIIILNKNCQTLVISKFDIVLIKGSECVKILDDLIGYDIKSINVTHDLEVTHYISVEDVATGNQQNIKYHHYLNGEDYYLPPKNESSIHIDGYIFLIKETGQIYCPHLYYKDEYVNHIKGMLLSYAI